MPARPRKTAKASTKKATSAAEKRAGSSTAASKKAAVKRATPRRPRAKTPRVIDFTVDPTHFDPGAGGGDTASGTFGDLVPPPGEEPTHRFRLLRPLDLVVLDVLGYGLELRKDADGHALVPVADDARLEVRYPFQHVGEQAFYRSHRRRPADD